MTGKAKGAKKERLWIVPATVTISMNVVVRAPSKEEAIEAAKSADMMSLCHQCSEGTSASRDDVLEWRTSGELDGEPQIDADGVEEV